MISYDTKANAALRMDYLFKRLVKYPGICGLRSYFDFFPWCLLALVLQSQSPWDSRKTCLLWRPRGLQGHPRSFPGGYTKCNRPRRRTARAPRRCSKAPASRARSGRGLRARISARRATRARGRRGACPAPPGTPRTAPTRTTPTRTSIPPPPLPPRTGPTTVATTTRTPRRAPPSRPGGRAISARGAREGGGWWRQLRAPSPGL